MHPFTVLDIFRVVFLKIGRPQRQQRRAMNAFLNPSCEAFENIQAKIVDVPTLKAATVNAEAHTSNFWGVFLILHL